MKEKEYVYNVEEYSQDVRRYQITSNVKLTHYEVSNLYREADDDKDTKSNLSGFMDWEDGTEENIGDLPDWVANRVDEFLNELEEEYE